MRFWKSFGLPLMVAFRLLGFTVNVGCFSRLLWSWRVEIGRWQVKMSKYHYFYWDRASYVSFSLSFFLFSLFLSFTNVSWVAVSFWLIFRVLKKSILKIFASFLIAFVEERIFRSPYPAFFIDVQSHWTLRHHVGWMHPVSLLAVIWLDQKQRGFPVIITLL